MINQTYGNNSPALASLPFQTTVSFVDVNDTTKIPVTASDTDLKFLNNTITAANVVTGSDTGASFSVSVEGKQDRAYELTVALESGGKQQCHVFKVAHFSLDAPLYNILSAVGTLGATIALTLTAGDDTISVDITGAPAATVNYKISLNFLNYNAA